MHDVGGGKRVQAPALLLIAVNGLGVLISAGNVYGGVMALWVLSDHPDDTTDLAMWGSLTAASCIGILGGLLALAGAIQMLRLRMRALAIAGAVISMIPVFGPCCLFGLPLGIWALMVLRDPAVRHAFEAKRAT